VSATIAKAIKTLGGKLNLKKADTGHNGNGIALITLYQQS
jgi:hypothetical protein